MHERQSLFFLIIRHKKNTTTDENFFLWITLNIFFAKKTACKYFLKYLHAVFKNYKYIRTSRSMCTPSVSKTFFSIIDANSFTSSAVASP